MSFAFTKMHGLGNDFVIIDTRGNPTFKNAGLHPADLTPSEITPAEITRLCDRRLGIGCDQLVTLAAPTRPGADVLVRFFNPDGSEAGACGNASRCVAALLGGTPTLQTAHGLLPAVCLESPPKEAASLADHPERQSALVRVRMGAPKLDWRDVPLAAPCDTLHVPIEATGRKFDAAACSMGNPHATLFGGPGFIEEAARIGAALENTPVFPERANIGFAEILSPRHMRLRVWERGAGLTLACGSGACAAVVNAVRRGLVDRRCTVTMELGDLEIVWQEEGGAGNGHSNGPVDMTGPAQKVFTGVYELASPQASSKPSSQPSSKKPVSPLPSPLPGSDRKL